MLAARALRRASEESAGSDEFRPENAEDSDEDHECASVEELLRKGATQREATQKENVQVRPPVPRLKVKCAPGKKASKPPLSAKGDDKTNRFKSPRSCHEGVVLSHSLSARGAAELSANNQAAVPSEAASATFALTAVAADDGEVGIARRKISKDLSSSQELPDMPAPAPEKELTPAEIEKLKQDPATAKALKSLERWDKKLAAAQAQLAKQRERGKVFQQKIETDFPVFVEKLDGMKPAFVEMNANLADLEWAATEPDQVIFDFMEGKDLTTSRRESVSFGGDADGGDGDALVHAAAMRAAAEEHRAKRHARRQAGRLSAGDEEVHSEGKDAADGGAGAGAGAEAKEAKQEDGLAITRTITTAAAVEKAEAEAEAKALASWEQAQAAMLMEEVEEHPSTPPAEAKAGGAGGMALRRPASGSGRLVKSASTSAV
jgi:hypothetical protein